MDKRYTVKISYEIEPMSREHRTAAMPHSEAVAYVENCHRRNYNHDLAVRKGEAAELRLPVFTTYDIEEEI